MRILRIMVPVCTAAVLALATACSSNKGEKGAQAADATEAEAAPAGQSPVIELAKGDSINYTSGKPVVIDFNATWCGPCKQFRPTFDAVAAETDGKVLFYSVDVDVHPELAAEFNASSIPMVVYISADGKTSTSKVGLQTKDEFSASVAELLK